MSSSNGEKVKGVLEGTYPWTDQYRVNPGIVEVTDGQTLPKLFEPLTIRNVTFKNRVVVPPMCMYSAEEGYVGDFHLAHLGSFAMGVAGLVIMEATSVTLDGRISPYCPTLHEDAQVAPIQRIAKFIHAQGAKFGIQLAHAGRKASSPPPFHGRSSNLTPSPLSWTPVAPSPIAFGPDWAIPKELSKSDILDLIQSFIDSTLRAERAGIDVIEIHAAHGYLMSNFLSPLSNHREDEYGGSFENRIRFLVQVVNAIRPIWSKPLFVRISADEYAEGGWNSNDTVELAKILKDLGVDVLDCSSGGNIHGALSGVSITSHPGYQVPYADEVKKKTGLMTMAVGLITEPALAEDILQKGAADLIAIGRQHLRNPSFTLTAANALSSTAAPSPSTSTAPLLPTYIPQYAWSIGKFKI